MTPDSQGFCPSGKHDAIKTQFSSTVKIISEMRTATRKLLSTACGHLTVSRHVVLVVDPDWSWITSHLATMETTMGFPPKT